MSDRRQVLAALLAACAASALHNGWTVEGEAPFDELAPLRWRQASAGERLALVQRAAELADAEAVPLLREALQDSDTACQAAAIAALAECWPHGMSPDDVALVRAAILNNDAAGVAACRFAEIVGDDEALPVLAQRAAALDDEAARKAMLGIARRHGLTASDPLAALEDHWAWLEHLAPRLHGSRDEVLAAIAALAQRRVVSSRAAALLIAAAEQHPEASVRQLAASLLATAAAPPARWWCSQRQDGRGEAWTGTGAAAASVGGAGTPSRELAAAAPPIGAVAAAATAEQEPPRAWWWLIALPIAALSAAALWRRRGRARAVARAFAAAARG